MTQRPMLLAAGLAVGTVHVSAAPQISSSPPQCRPAAALARVAELPEGSGVAASRRHAGHAWAHNDSGEPILFALNDRGAVVARLRLTGASVEDWEAIAVAPCAAGGSCIYVADIGDNDAERSHITIYRLPEPALSSGTAAVQDVWRASYPDAAHDAEALFVSPTGAMFIVTKGETGPITLYRFPRDARPGTTVKLQRVGQPRDGGAARSSDRITDGAMSPDGAHVVLRTTRALIFFDAADLTAGNWRERGRVGVEDLGEPQGEGVAFADDKTLYLVGEGGGEKQPGSFARVTCTPSHENPGATASR